MVTVRHHKLGHGFRVNGQTLVLNDGALKAGASILLCPCCDCCIADPCEGCGRDIVARGRVRAGTPAVIECSCGTRYTLREVRHCYGNWIPEPG
ncbi:hypothetical protein HY251_07240 [bacterium]|nr:hypothetical protein [bacterium]